MKINKLNFRKQRKFNLIVSVTTVFVAAFVMAQLMFSPSMVQTVYAGSTLTPTSVPADTATPVPPPTDTPIPPPPTNTPEPSNSGGSSSSPAPSPTPVPVVPQEIPELGVGSTWQPLLLTLTILLIAFGVAIVQVRHLLKEPSE